MAEQRSSWWKWMLAGVTLLLVAGGYWHFRHGRSEAINYNTQVVTRGDLTASVTATGTLNPVKSVQVGCQVSGRITDIFVDYNSQVKAGDMIAQIETRTYQAQLESAQADIANATASLELQQAQAKRAADLYQNKLLSQSDYDVSQASLHQAEAVLKIKQASLENAKANLGYTKIFSPVDGVVITRAVDVGQTVAASFNTPTLFLIANDLTKMQINAAVSEADVGNVAEGQAVEFTVDAYPTRTFHGQVTQVRNSPTTVNNVVTYDAVIGVTNADYKLKPGMTASVSIITAERSNALKLPNSALRFRPPENAVVLTNELAGMSAPTNMPTGGMRGKGSRGVRNVRTLYILAGDEKAPVLKPVQVRTGITDGISTEIVDGLKEGDKIVSGTANGESETAAGANPFGGPFQRPRR